MDTNTNSNKSYIVLLGVSVLCLVTIIGSVTYAYFTARVQGEGAKMNVTAGKVAVEISEEKITATGVVPIYDKNKDTQANANTFTVSRTSDSNLNACYSLFLDVESVAENLKSPYFKWELEYDNGKYMSGNFSEPNYSDDGTVTIPLVTNQELNSTTNSLSYTLRLWLSYDANVDQTSLLTGDATTRSFTGHIRATGKSGTCKVD